MLAWWSTNALVAMMSSGGEWIALNSPTGGLVGFGGTNADFANLKIITGTSWGRWRAAVTLAFPLLVWQIGIPLTQDLLIVTAVHGCGCHPRSSGWD